MSYNLKTLVRENPIDVRHPEFGGVDPTGAADSTATIQAALDALPTVSAMRRGKVFVPYGIYKITSTLTLQGAWQAEIEFERGTRLMWEGANNVAMWRFPGCRELLFGGGVYIQATTSAPLLDGVRIETKTGFVSTANHFRDVIIEGTNGGVTNGFRIMPGDLGDANNDYMQFHHCEVWNYIGKAFSIEATQAKAQHFHRCGWSTNNWAGGAGVSRGISVDPSGAFSAVECAGGSTQDCDFYIGAPNDPCYILGGGFENSNRFIRTAGPGVSPYPLTVTGTRWSNQLSSPGLNADGRIVIYQFGGPLSLIGCLFDGSASLASKFFINNGMSDAFIAIGNLIYTTEANPWESQQPCLAMANHKNNGGTLTAFPNIIGTSRSDTGPIADGETGIYLSRNVSGTVTSQRVSMGATDSGGSGFKLLRVPN